MRIYTMGLPNGVNPTQKYEFDIQDIGIYISGDYIGRDQVGEPHFPEQANWLNNLKPAIKIQEVWYGSWQCQDKDELEKVLQQLKPFQI